MAREQQTSRKSSAPKSQRRARRSGQFQFQDIQKVEDEQLTLAQQIAKERFLANHEPAAEKDDDGLLELNLDTEEANRLENCIIYAIFTIFFLFVFIFVLYLIHMKTFNDYPATGDEITL